MAKSCDLPVFWSKSTLCLVGMVIMALLCSCNREPPPLTIESTPTPAIHDQTIQEVQTTLANIQESQRQLILSQKSIENMQHEADQIRQQSAFLKGACISGTIISLLVGAALGSKARNAAKRKR
jgi:hypothetical protein